jgi:acyl-coenzyme A synthetase/AMP-(fatty) acid ligase
MNMQRGSLISLSNAIAAAGALSSRLDAGVEGNASWGELAAGSALDLRTDELRGSSVLLAVIDQFSAAAAMIQLDGVARRMALYPPGLSREHLAYVAETAGAGVIVTDQPLSEPGNSRDVSIAREVPITRGRAESNAETLAENSPVETEWILLTSGTTGRPKLVQHTLASLTAAIEPGHRPGRAWSTFYDIRRYGGLQIFLRSVLTGTPLVLKSAQQSVAEFLTRAGELGVTHILGTPSHWRRALMSPAANSIAPQYVRLSGEIADQAILNNLRRQYPRATIAHAFASTEAGVAFVVEDGLMGLPADSLMHTPGVEMKVEAGTLRVRSNRTATRYLGDDGPPLKDAEGFVDTGDAIELRDGRYYFAGRRDGIINVGGLKVHPEEVEAVINRHPQVSMSLVRSRKSPITGAIVVADVVLKAPPSTDNGSTPALQRDILQFCRAELALHKVPAAINFVPILAVSDSGKMVRSHA